MPCNSCACSNKVVKAAVENGGRAPLPILSSEEYYLVSDAHGGTEPEWDEDDAAYYMRFTGSKEALGAKYRLAKVSEEEDPNVDVMTPVKLINSESKRGLSYKAAGEDGYFMVEAADDESVHVFHLEKAAVGSDSEAFYLIHGPRAGGAGPLAYLENSVTYMKADPSRSHGDLPLFLKKAPSPAEASANFGSVCDSSNKVMDVAKPVRILSSEEYHIVSDAHGGMEPEWDEGDAVHYMRFTGSKEALGAKYKLVKVSGEEEPNIDVTTPVKMINSESKRGLSYKAAGEDGYFLVEAAEDLSAHVFHLEKVDATLRSCEAYYLIHGPRPGGAGPLAFPEDGVIYMKADPTRSHGDLPLHLKRAPETNDVCLA